MTTPLRLIFGGSNRRHHLGISRVAAGMIAPAPALLYPQMVAACTWAHLSPPTRLGFAVLGLVAGVACVSQELFATADRDTECQRRPKTKTRSPWWWAQHRYWRLYDMCVGHRSRFSHGPLGTIIRTVYGWWWLLPLLWMASPWLFAAWWVGCAWNDLFHLALDL